MAKFRVVLEMDVEASGKLDAVSGMVGQICNGVCNMKTLEDIGVKVLKVDPHPRTVRKRGLVHDDGVCANGKYETFLNEDGMCPACKIYPDMQSTAIMTKEVPIDE